MVKLEKMTFEKLITLYSIVSEICQDYSRMTDNYSLATGDNKFESMPIEIRTMVNERQQFFSYRNRIKELLKSKIIKIMENEED